MDSGSILAEQCFATVLPLLFLREIKKPAAGIDPATAVVNRMKVISVFDGISCARVALASIGIQPECYDAAEINPHAIDCSRCNWPDIHHIGDVITYSPTGTCDLLIGGSPCQDVSCLNLNRQGLNGPKSSLFEHYVRILEQVQPKWFILENVASMAPRARDAITHRLGVQPIRINSALLTAQLRDRLYWTNIANIPQPQDRGMRYPDILDHGYTPRQKALCLNCSYLSRQSSQIRRSITLPCVNNIVWYSEGVYRFWDCEIKNRPYTAEQQVCWNALTLTRDHRYTPLGHRALNPREREQLQGLPVGYTRMLSDRQACEAIGNGFTVPVIAHILRAALDLPVCEAGASQPGPTSRATTPIAKGSRLIGKYIRQYDE